MVCLNRSSSRQADLLAKAERDGEKYFASLHVTSLQELRRLPAANLLGGIAGVITIRSSNPTCFPSALTMPSFPGVKMMSRC